MDAEAARKLIAEFDKLGIAIADKDDAFRKLTATASGTNDTLDRTSSALSKAGNAAGQAAKGVATLTGALIDHNNNYSSLVRSYGGGALFQSVADQFASVNKVTEAASNSLLKMFGADVESAIKKFTGPLAGMSQEMLGNYMQYADAIGMLEKGSLAAAAASGNLGKVIAAAGSDMRGMPTLLKAQADMMKETTASTGYLPAQVQSFYASFSQIPGSFEKIQLSGQSTMSGLAAALKLADGTGRDLTSVISDLKTAYDDYGITGQDALTFSASISQVAIDNGIQFSKLQQQVQSTAGSFRLFADTGEAAAKMAKGSTDILNTYIDSLKRTGITGEQSAEIISNMTKQVGQLNIAQKAFLSAQTGGPGGLMGGFQIEKMLKEGDIQGVFDKVQTQMRKQLGSIVSLEQASTSEAAARQLQRQITMLRSGPLGQFARSDQEAMRILESMRTGKDATKAIGPDVLKDSVERGNELQKSQITIFTNIEAKLEDIRINLGFQARENLRKAGVTAAGNPFVEEASKRAQTATGDLAGEFSKTMASGDRSKLETLIQRRADEREAEDLKNIIDSFTMIPSKLKEMLENKSPEKIRADIESGLFDKYLEGAQDTMKSSDLAEMRRQADEFKSRIQGPIGSDNLWDSIKKMEEQELKKAEESTSKNVANAASTSVRRTQATEMQRAAMDESAAAAFERKRASEPFQISVSAICVKCKNDLDHQLRGGAPGAAFNQ